MGNYTSIRCKAIIKEEYRGSINGITNYELDWQDLNIDFAHEFSKYPKADFIPNGVLMGEPSHWEAEPYPSSGIRVATGGFGINFDEETSLWSFQCSLKDPGETVQAFIDLVLTNIVDVLVDFEVVLEPNEVGDFYEMTEDGKIQKL